MGFKTVFQCLMDVFPEVDARLLKAVAIEHPKDADAAVEVVLSEIVPYVESLKRSPGVSSSPAFSRLATGRSPPRESSYPSVVSDGEVEHEGPNAALIRRPVRPASIVGSSSGVISMSEEDCNSCDLTAAHDSGSTFPEKTVNEPIVLSSDTGVDSNQLIGNIESEELILFGNPQRQQDHVQTVSNKADKDVSKSLIHEDNTAVSQVCATTENEGPASSVRCQGLILKAGHEQIGHNVIDEDALDLHDTEAKDCDSSITDDFDFVIGGKSPQAESCQADTASGVKSSPIDDCQSMLSNHQSKIECLEEMVEAAKNNKKTLFSAVDSVMNMMKQVDLAEKAAEQAKEEAARGGLDILVKVEDLKEMLAHAKETNDMHAGEVYGEKAILATEVKELQARLISLSDERDNALATLDEMRQVLEARLAEAEGLSKEAEQEKLEKEESARSAFGEVEILMENVVEESKILRQEAEDNSKLRDFLMDRGRVVDTLQGEISVICQDVRLLKEKFDDRVPLSQSISSSQTSCILASSGSSLRSVKSDLVAEIGETSTGPKPKSLASSGVSSPADAQSPKVGTQEDQITDNRKELIDDGWDLFENEEMQNLESF